MISLKNSPLRTSGLLLCIAAALAGSACSSSRRTQARFDYVEQPVEQIYSRATDSLERRRWDESIALFEEVERQHPYSAWARRAMLMKAFTRYQANDYDEAVAAIDQFIALHPGNKDAAYAYYLKSMCFYEQIRDVGRDQDITNNAVTALNDVIRRYPASEYARDARLKLDLTYDHLAGKEMYVGRFYLRQSKHIAAINRFKYVVSNYQRTSHVPEALHRLVEAYLEVGIETEARSAAAFLAHNYPGSRWYEDTFGILRRNGLVKKWAALDPAVAVIPRAQKTAKVDGDDGKVTAKDLEDADFYTDLQQMKEAAESEDQLFEPPV
ncbi:MAG: outer membrane protein assembly factor BamD [Pseudomonadota bacterium]